MNKNYHFPDIENLSIVIASILLTYSLSRFITLPELIINFNLLGVYLTFTINVYTLVSLLVIIIAALGTIWLLNDHPLTVKHNINQHIFIPTITAWVIGFPIIQLSFSSAWMISFMVGGVLLVMVIIAEYLTLNPEDQYQPIASTVLSVVSYAILLILAITFHNLGTRLILVIPTIFVVSYLICIRNFNLRLHLLKTNLESLAVTLITCQITAALHYWPLSPLGFGLAILGPIYAINNYLTNLAENKSSLRLYIEPSITLIVLWGLAYIYR